MPPVGFGRAENFISGIALNYSSRSRFFAAIFCKIDCFHGM